MISYNHLGCNGRIGNQMFQYAALLGIAEKHGYQFCIPSSNFNDPSCDHQLFEVFELKNLKKENIKKLYNVNQIKESGFHFDYNLFETCPHNVDIFGYFQTEKYFKHIRDELLKDFEFRDEILEPCKEMMSQFDTAPISLHIRRTDYITDPNHTALGLDYYEDALKQFGDNEVLVFSDDPEWCNQQELFSEDRFLIAEGNTNYVDLCLMTLCSGHIIANSSFSWWGAWLSNSKKVVAPSGWFKGSDNEHLDTKDIIPETWTVI